MQVDLEGLSLRGRGCHDVSVIDPSGVACAYNTVAGDYAQLIPDVRVEARMDLAMVDEFVAAVGSGMVLDAGCGAGRMTRYLADRGAAVVGVDISSGMVEMAGRDHGDLSFTVGSLTDLPYADCCFGGVMLWYSTIHTPWADQLAIFSEVRRVLRPGGFVLVGFQSGAGVRDVSGFYRARGHDVELLRYLFAPEEVIDWMNTVGLHEVCRMTRRPRGGERDDQTVLLSHLN